MIPVIRLHGRQGTLRTTEVRAVQVDRHASIDRRRSVGHEASRGFDLKAVNPNAKSTEDTRTPEELLDIIESKGREASDAIAALSHLLRDESPLR